jgi:hypothetical protein
VETENFFKRDNSVINHQTTTKFKLDLRNPMTYPYIKFELNVCNPYRDNERKLKISFLFFLFKRDNSVKNQWTITKFELHLRIPMANLHMQFEPYTCIQTKVRERKLKLISRGITLSKNHPTMTKFELDLHNPSMMYWYTKFELNVCNRSRDNEWKPFMEWRNDRMTKGITLYAPGHFMAGA